ncbi:RnfH family protein [Cognatiluteimonas telluris]|jgi:putative ubiquitin-RnfH superfamily antitoxin RatB of RatAB toxin-antitoxin module|uniref:RnfH family protein n=1 Tax=Cognatiluteimonas telluris TaxID=1104775 RepID=UPI00140AFA5F|nr:RnfH family protein [Lysobacter telluris]
MRVEVVRAWPRRLESLALELPATATVADAVAACGWSMDGIAAIAIFGRPVAGAARLHEGDRIELLRPLLADPKDARRRRASRLR